MFRLKDGLKTLGVLDAIIAHPDAFQPLMCAVESVLTAQVVEGTFTPCLSATGSNTRATENRNYSWWLDLLQDVEGWRVPLQHTELTFAFLLSQCHGLHDHISYSDTNNLPYLSNETSQSHGYCNNMKSYVID